MFSTSEGVSSSSKILVSVPLEIYDWSTNPETGTNEVRLGAHVYDCFNSPVISFSEYKHLWTASDDPLHVTLLSPCGLEDNDEEDLCKALFLLPSSQKWLQRCKEPSQQEGEASDTVSLLNEPLFSLLDFLTSPDHTFKSLSFLLAAFCVLPSEESTPTTFNPYCNAKHWLR